VGILAAQTDADGSVGRQVRLSVNVWYDPSTKRVHVTSNDPDLPREGLCTNLKPGTQADRSARSMLRKFGKLPPAAGT
jgi:hypothetical protein